jgi:pyrroloquinoline quinone biosynthesis protein E
MQTVGSVSNAPTNPQWLLAELTYRCPLRCLYCSNPLDFASYHDELSTDDWLRVLRETRALGAVQLGFSGGEPLLRKDLEILVAEARRLGYYSNLITSGIGMDEARLAALKQAGLDHVQISFQASAQELNDYIGGAKTFQRKLAMARLIKHYDYPMVLNVVLHRHNIDHIASILDMAEDLNADYVELANTQYYGWALLNRSYLLPSREQVERAQSISHAYQERLRGQMRILYVIPDYYATRPKPCMAGWGSLFMAITPDGTVLPCHAARQLPGLTFPNVREADLRWIWYDSPGFSAFRGDAWMKEPCRSCPERHRDFGGCRCQSYLLTGDAANTDPVCEFAPQHDIVLRAIDEAANWRVTEMLPMFRTVKHSKELSV